MKIIKTESKTKLPEVYKKGFGKFVNSFKNNIGRNIIIIGSVLLIGGAVWLNWFLFADADKNKDYDSKNYNQGETSGKTDNEQNRPSGNTSESDSYFAMAQIDRTRARDEALEVLYQITSSKDATEEAKQEAYNSITKLSAQIEQEANIETLVKSKGFEECVAVIDDKGASIIVLTDGLIDSQVSQIVSIVYEQSGIKPENIKISEKKSK